MRCFSPVTNPVDVNLSGIQDSEGQGSLASYSPWDCKDSDTAEHAHGIEQNATGETICRAGMKNRGVDPAGEGKGLTT